MTLSMQRRGRGRASTPPPAITEITRATFRVQVADQLRQAIIRGEIVPGSQVTEVELAGRFGISRGPLREAMSQLASEGLLTTVPYTGTRVMTVSIDDIREIYSLRTALETLAFRHVWPQRGAEFGAEIERRHIALLETVVRADSFASTAAELRLHSLVYEACGHKLLFETWSRIAGRLQVYLAVHQRAHNRKAPLYDAHERYVKLAQGRNLDAMITEIEQHMRRGVAQLETFITDGSRSNCRRTRC